ncbi:MAG: hypothetical protein JXR58_02465 [Bacteroidales bacterium]|nr:hypothetical protein [Bacteroidales bacterium]
MKKPWILWTLAALITLLAAYYQRTTGPTYPRKINVEINGKTEKIKFPRSWAGEKDFKLEINDIKGLTEAKVWFKRYPSNDEFASLTMTKEDENLIAYLPLQPQAGKLAYYLELKSDKKSYFVAKEEPIVIRFRGDVPAGIMIAHIALIFLAMFFSNLAGLFVIARKKTYKLWGNIAFFVMLVGGMIFGPLMQKAAFGEYWTGFPNGMDLTDNKTLIAFVFWILAFALNIKKQRPVWVLVASIVTIVIFSIPHSLLGSEYNYEANKVVTGFIGGF